VAATWRLVGRLADKGFIVRQPDPTDRRLVRLQLTDAAHQAYPRWRASVADTVSRLFAGSSTEDLAALGRVCARIASNARTVTH
jgi:DNA-binding MarR family transcriptional regulator